MYRDYAVRKGEPHDAEWQMGPGDSFLGKLIKVFGNRFYAEDLGNEIEAEVYSLLERHDIPGMAVAQFANWNEPFNPDDRHHPDNYTRMTVANIGTHDNPTAREWFNGLDAQTQGLICTYFEATPQNIISKIIEKIFVSKAGTVIINMSDILDLGPEGRINRPGTGAEQIPPNLSWRLESFDEFIKKLPWLAKIAARS